MSRFIFEAARVFDGRNEPADELYDVVVADGMIQEVEVAGKIASSQATRIACEGRTLMPGLIDAHVHVYVASLRPDVLANKPPTYFAHYAAGFFKGSLDRGFTTLGSVTEPVLQAMGFRSYVLRKTEEIDKILGGAQILADDSKKPVAVLLTKSVLGVK